MTTVKNLLIVGDSFSSEQISDQFGWPVLLKEDFKVTNLSGPGIGEFKILQKLQSVDLNKFDLIIISHTSPNRIHCQYNPLYPDGHVYRNSDVIFADAESKIITTSAANHLVYYYKYIFDETYYQFIHRCCCREIDQLTQNQKVLHITHFDWDKLYVFPGMINYYNFWLRNRGEYSHYTKEANIILYQQIKEKLRNYIK
jgi:hypothetical protein